MKIYTNLGLFTNITLLFSFFLIKFNIFKKISILLLANQISTNKNSLDETDLI